MIFKTHYERMIVNMDIKIANWMLKFVAKVCNEHKGLRVRKYYKGVSDIVGYELESCDCG